MRQRSCSWSRLAAAVTFAAHVVARRAGRIRVRRAAGRADGRQPGSLGFVAGMVVFVGVFAWIVRARTDGWRTEHAGIGRGWRSGWPRSSPGSASASSSAVVAARARSRRRSRTPGRTAGGSPPRSISLGDRASATAPRSGRSAAVATESRGAGAPGAAPASAHPRSRRVVGGRRSPYSCWRSRSWSGRPAAAGPEAAAAGCAASGGMERLTAAARARDRGGLPTIGDVTGRQVILRGVNVNQLIDYHLRDPAVPADAAAHRRRLRPDGRDGLQRRPPRHVLVAAGARAGRVR